jgi:16S rRNA (uracil1498-N3)-methyltransferase
VSTPRVPADVGAAAHVFVDALDDRCEIGGDDGHHLRRVRRLGTGERVTAADGTGAWRAYEIVATGPAALVLDACGTVQVERAPSVELVLAVALAKGGVEGVVAAVTELGVARVVPLHTARTIVRWDEARAAAAVRRLRAVARESAMQARRARVPVVDEVTELAAVAAGAGVVVADRGGAPARELAPPPGGKWTVVVGPEGGFAPDERVALRGAPVLSVGPYVLKASTAPVAAVAVLADRIAQMSRP